MKKLYSARFATLCVVLVVMLTGANAVSAQEVTATITGTVMDPSGAAVADAAVAAKSVERGIVYTAVTNESGIYRLSQLPVGSYDLKIEKRGFQTSK